MKRKEAPSVTFERKNTVSKPTMMMTGWIMEGNKRRPLTKKDLKLFKQSFDLVGWKKDDSK